MASPRNAPDDQERKQVQSEDQEINVGQGGEIHQIAGEKTPTLTTQQGIPVADDQNSLSVGYRGPRLC
jgi:catalase